MRKLALSAGLPVVVVAVLLLAVLSTPKSEPPPAPVESAESEPPAAPPSIPDEPEEPARPVGHLTVTVTAAEDGTPLQGVEVRAYLRERGARWQETAATDAAGIARFEPPTGRIRLSCGIEGRQSPGSLEVTVEEGTPASLEVRLARTATLLGRVLEKEGGAPVAGAAIVNYAGKRIAETDADGRFELAGLRHETGFAIRSPWHAPNWQHVKDLLPGVRNEREFRVVRGGRILGRVVDATGAPVAGAWVATYWRSVAGAHHGARKSRWVVETDEAGRFALDGELPGERRVFATSPAHGSAASAPISVEPGEAVNDVVLTLEPGATVTFLLRTEGDEKLPSVTAKAEADPDDAWAPVAGERTRMVNGVPAKEGRLTLSGLRRGSYRIVLSARGWLPRTFESPDLLPEDPGGSREIEVVLSRGERIEGTLTNAAGRGLAGTTIWATREKKSKEDPYFSNWATSDEEGRFVISGLLPGTYTLTCRKGGVQVVEEKGVAAGCTGVALRWGARSTELTGRLILPEPRTYYHVTLLAFRDDGENPIGSGKDGTVWGSGTRDEYRIELAPGDWWLLASSRDGIWAMPKAVRVTVKPGEGRGPDLRVFEAGAVEGTVRGPDGPVANALVVAWPFPMDLEVTRYIFRGDLRTYLETRTDERGRFRIGRVGPGEWTLRAWHRDWLPAGATVTLAEPGRTVRQDLTLAPGAWIEVQVRAPGPDPFPCWVVGPAPPDGSRPDVSREVEFMRQAAGIRTAQKKPPLIRSGDVVRRGPYVAGTFSVSVRATFDIPGSDEQVRLRKYPRVTVRDAETVRVEVAFTAEEIERARKGR